MDQGRSPFLFWVINPALSKGSAAYSNLSIHCGWGGMIGISKQMVTESVVEGKSRHSALHSRDGPLQQGSSERFSETLFQRLHQAGWRNARNRDFSGGSDPKWLYDQGKIPNIEASKVSRGGIQGFEALRTTPETYPATGDPK